MLFDNCQESIALAQHRCASFCFPRIFIIRKNNIYESHFLFYAWRIQVEESELRDAYVSTEIFFIHSPIETYLQANFSFQR